MTGRAFAACFAPPASFPALVPLVASVIGCSLCLGEHGLQPVANRRLQCELAWLLTELLRARGHALLERGRTGGRPAVVGRAVEQARRPRLAVAPACVAPAQVAAAGADGVDLVQRQRVIVDAHLDEQRAGVAHQLVAEDDRVVAALQAALQVADIVQQRGAAERAEHRGDAGLGGPLLIERLRVGDRRIGEAGQPIEPGEVGRSRIAEEVLGRAVHVDGGAHVEGAAADAVHERRTAGVSWWTTRPLSVSAFPTTMVAVMDAGAVVPAAGAGA